MATNLSAHPIEILQQYITELNAAVQLCLEDPAKKPVHRVRTTTRRIEAQLALLNILQVPKVNGRKARAARRLLKKIRRAAAEVRDLDVQQDQIAAHTPATSRTVARKLREELEQQRIKAARDLVDELKKHHTTLSATLESLVKVFSESEPVTLTSAHLKALTLRWFATQAPAPSDDTDNLHDIRKKAKLARYLAENAPKQARSTRRIAEAFESLQETGGQWHDWLILSAIAAKKTGESSPLTKAFTRRCERNLASYRKLLATSIPTA